MVSKLRGLFVKLWQSKDLAEIPIQLIFDYSNWSLLDTKTSSPMRVEVHLASGAWGQRPYNALLILPRCSLGLSFW